MPVRLNIESGDTASFAIGSSPAAPVSDLRLQGEAFTGNTIGTIESPDAQRAGATKLSIKLVAVSGKLFGRVFATAGDPDFRNVRLPYVLTLERVSG